MNKKEFVYALAKKGGYTKKDAEGYIANVLEVIEDALVNGDDVKIIGFGNFKVRTRSARTTVDPRNKENKLEIPETKIVSFSAGKTLKDRVNKRK